MKKDLETILTVALAWLIGVAGWAVMCVLFGIAAKLSWIPITFGWNLI